MAPLGIQHHLRDSEHFGDAAFRDIRGRLKLTPVLSELLIFGYQPMSPWAGAASLALTPAAFLELPKVGSCYLLNLTFLSASQRQGWRCRKPMGC